MRFALFPPHLSKALRLPRKSEARMKCCACHAKSSPKTEDLMLQSATSLKKSAPGPPNISDEHPSHCTCHATCIFAEFCRSSWNVPRLPTFFKLLQKPSRFAHFWHGAQSLAHATRNDIWTSKNGPNMWCFSHFDLEMCFAPQWRALFRHLNFQKSEHTVFLTFWLPNVLRATTACTFWTCQLPKVVWHWGALYILTWKCASGRNGVLFFDITTSKSGPSMVCFVHFDFQMCFAPQRRALFRHLNFQKWSNVGVLCAF